MNLLNSINEKISTDPSIIRIKDWYSSLTAKDQLILKSVLGLAAVALIAGLVISPLLDRNHSLNKELNKQLSLYNKMADNGYKFSSGNRSSSPNKPLLAQVSDVLRRRQVTLSRYEQDGDSLRIWLDNTSFDAAITSLEELNALGILVNQINIDRDDTEGRTDIRATISR